MRAYPAAIGLALLMGLGGSAGAGERPVSRLCPEDAPEGVRLPPRPGCRDEALRAAPRDGEGFVDLGNGTHLRVGGRTRLDVGNGR